MSEVEAWIEALLKNREREGSVSRVLSASESPMFDNEGENNLSDVSQLSVRVVTGNGEVVVKSLIVKRLPEKSLSRDWVVATGSNVVEFTVYRDVLPAMENVMTECDMYEEPLWPKLLAMKPYSELVLEDLTPQGFKMLNRIKGLDFEHCALVMQNLGLYHALSVALIDSRALARKAFDRHTLESCPMICQVVFDQPLKDLQRVVEGWGSEWADVAAKLKTRAGDFHEDIFNSFKMTKGEFEVLIHGDCWTNNILFKYDIYTEKPVQLKLVDYQMSQLASPAVDLILFFVTSPDLQTRTRSRELISIYYDSLILNMNRLRLSDSVRRPTLQFILDECNRLTHFKISLVAFFLPKVLMRRCKESSVDFDVFRDCSWNDSCDEYLVEVTKMILKEAVEDGSL